MKGRLKTLFLEVGCNWRTKLVPQITICIADRVLVNLMLACLRLPWALGFSRFIWLPFEICVG